MEHGQNHPPRIKRNKQTRKHPQKDELWKGQVRERGEQEKTEGMGTIRSNRDGETWETSPYDQG